MSRPAKPCPACTEGQGTHKKGCPHKRLNGGPCHACATGSGRHRRTCPHKGQHGDPARLPVGATVIVPPSILAGDDAHLAAFVRGKVRNKDS